MRELTLEEIEAVSGAGFWGEFWGGINSFLQASADFLGFDGHFGAGGGSGGFFGAVGNLFGGDSRGIIIIGEAGFGHEDGEESEARRLIEERFGDLVSIPEQGIAAGAAAQAAGTLYAHSSVDLADFFSQFLANGFSDLRDGYLYNLGGPAAGRFGSLSDGVPAGDITLSDPHFSLANPAIGGGE